MPADPCWLCDVVSNHILLSLGVLHLSSGPNSSNYLIERVKISRYYAHEAINAVPAAQ